MFDLERRKDGHIALQYVHIPKLHFDYRHVVFWSSVAMVDTFQQDWLIKDTNGNFVNYHYGLPTILSDWLKMNIGYLHNEWYYNPTLFRGFDDPHWRFIGFKEKTSAMHFLLKWA